MQYPVLRIAHRGASGLYPENTMLAFREAMRAGVDALEVDVQITRDEHLVILHDATLDRTTNGAGHVHAHTLAEVRELDAGRGEGVPTLDEVIAFARASDLSLYIEVKGETDTLSRAITDGVVAAVRRADFVGRTIVTSFFPGVLRRAKMSESRLATLLDPSPQDGSLSPAEICEQTLAAYANIISFDFEYVTPEVARAAFAAGLALYPWAPSTPADIRRMTALFVPGIMTDRPDILNEVLHAASV